MSEDPRVPAEKFHALSEAKKWAEKANDVLPSRKVFIEAFVNLIDQLTPAPKTVLELGSGPGFLAESILSRFQVERYTLLDFSEAMHEIAGARLEAHRECCQFMQADLRQPDWMDGIQPQDLVVTQQTVHEMVFKGHAAQLFSQTHDLLASGGHFLYCDLFYSPNFLGNDPRMYLTQAEQTEALTKAGFASVELVLAMDGLSLFNARKS